MSVRTPVRVTLRCKWSRSLPLPRSPLPFHETHTIAVDNAIPRFVGARRFEFQLHPANCFARVHQGLPGRLLVARNMWEMNLAQRYMTQRNALVTQIGGFVGLDKETWYWKAYDESRELPFSFPKVGE